MGNGGIVKYNNDMNSVSFGKFKEKELDLFFSICFKVKELGLKEVELSFSELRELSNYSNRNLDRFIRDLSSTYDKMLGLNIQIKYSEIDFEKFNLFDSYKVSGTERKISIQVSKKFEYLLNNLIGNYTKFDLIDFVSLKSSYSKNVFKLLKQWESLKQAEYDIENFKDLLGVPVTYTTAKFNERVLKPIIEELPQYFPNLKLEKIKTGKKVTSLKFTWSGKVEKIESIPNDDAIDIIEISEKLNQAIEKAKKNRFIEKLLTIDNIEILTQMFQENDLVKGLIWAYKEVRQDISTLNYLIKTIRTGAEKKEKKIVVKKSEEKQEDIFDRTFEEVPLNFEKDIPKDEVITLDQKIVPQKISKEEYENLYKIYLKENDIKNLKSVRKGFDLSNKSKYEIVENEPQEKIYLVSELPQEKLLSKSGKKLVGGALNARLEKIAKDEKIKIEHNGKIIKGE